MALPKKITIREVGPREGIQFEKKPISTEAKIRLIDLLSECGFPEIEVTSFVSPKWVPQMADAEQVVAGITPVDGTIYTGVYLNTKGMERAFATGKLRVHGAIGVTASETFSVRNTNATIEETLASMPERIRAFHSLNVPIEDVSVMAAFGCNYEGNVDPNFVVDLISRMMEMLGEQQRDVKFIQLADTMGWANPVAIRGMVDRIRKRWPDTPINLHLHDTRGLALANAFAAMELGVADFDASVAGLGGCPFGGFAGAAGNIVTEDLVHMCHEFGIETGINLDAVLEVAREAEELVGHSLPGKVMRGGNLASYRRVQ